MARTRVIDDTPPYGTNSVYRVEMFVANKGWCRVEMPYGYWGEDGVKRYAALLAKNPSGKVVAEFSGEE